MAVSTVIPNLENIKEIFGSLLESRITSCASIKGGRNSQVYKFESAQGTSFIGKFYYQGKDDPRDRLGVEYSSLQFLWQKGVRCIPQPLINSSTNNCAIYQYIDGMGFNGQEISKADIDQVLELIVLLQNVKKDVPVGQFTAASAASFSIKEIWTNIEWRRRRFNDVSHGALKDFLERDFDPFLVELLLWGKEHASHIGIDLHENISLDKRTLSPSDLGFHNAIKRNDGKIVFCDFEYFGWDDPAKLIADFLLHPAMELSEDLKTLFVRGVQEIFADYKDLNARVGLVYPFYGMTWCLILLNEFIVQDLSKRIFANHQIDKEQLLKEQLDKAKGMLTNIRNTYTEFPYAKK